MNHQWMRAMTSKQRKRKDEPLIDPPPYPNDWFEWVTLIVAMTGITGGAWALFYLWQSMPS